MGELIPRLADGGLATWLQGHGLPAVTPVHGFLRDRPELILAAHRAFVQAGADLLVAGTFRAMPGIESDWEALQDRAVALAREAADGRAVWGSIGPWTNPVGSPGSSDHTAATEAWRRAADHLAERVDGLILETFTDLRSGLAALQAVGPRDLPVVLTWSPDPDGDLYDGTPPGEAVQAALAAGATASGFNCGVDPEGVARAVERSGARGLWARPAGVVDQPGALAEALGPLLDRCAVIGGCCGASPEAIGALGSAR